MEERLGDTALVSRRLPRREHDHELPVATRVSTRPRGQFGVFQRSRARFSKYGRPVGLGQGRYDPLAAPTAPAQPISGLMMPR